MSSGQLGSRRPRRALAAALGLATAALAAAALAPAAAGQGTGFYGVGAQGPLATDDYERMRDGGVGTLRVPIRWRDVQPSPTNYRWEEPDEVIGEAAAHGVRVLAVIHGRSPQGLRTPPTRSADRDAFRRLMAQLVARYGPGGEYWEGDYLLQYPLALGEHVPVTIWQLGNEPNGRHHWGGRPSPRAYGRLLLAGARGVRGVHRGAEIVLGGMFGTPSGRGSVRAWRFLDRMYRVKGIKRAFDTVGVHPFSPHMRGIRYQMRRIRAVMVRRKDRRAGIRVTELGWGSASGGHQLNKGLKGQARMLRRSFGLLRKYRKRWRVRGVNWFSWQDGNSPCGFCPSAGLFSGGPGSRTPKPAWGAFRRFTR
jgi:hypothetical protein